MGRNSEQEPVIAISPELSKLADEIGVAVEDLSPENIQEHLRAPHVEEAVLFGLAGSEDEEVGVWKMTKAEIAAQQSRADEKAARRIIH